MGPRIDGEPLIDIASPDDPISRLLRWRLCRLWTLRWCEWSHTSRGGAAAAVGQWTILGSLTSRQPLKRLQSRQLTGATPNEEVGYGKMRLAQLVTYNQNRPKSLLSRAGSLDSDCEFATITALVTDLMATRQGSNLLGYRLQWLGDEEQSQTYVIPTTKPSDPRRRGDRRTRDQHRSGSTLTSVTILAKRSHWDDGCTGTTSSAIPLFAVRNHAPTPPAKRHSSAVGNDRLQLCSWFTDACHRGGTHRSATDISSRLTILTLCLRGRHPLGKRRDRRLFNPYQDTIRSKVSEGSAWPAHLAAPSER